MRRYMPTRWRSHAAPSRREEMDRLFGPMMWPFQEMERRLGESEVKLPAIDVDEDEKEVRVTAEMPGLSKDDFKVEITENRLSIHGEKKDTREEKEEGYHYSECTYGAFNRSVALPAEVKADQADAVYKDGVLTIRLPKKEETKAKQIDVKVS